MVEVGIALLVTMVILVARGLLDQRAVERDWSLFLQPWGREIIDELKQRAHGEAYMVSYAHQKALDAIAGGRHEDAVRLIDTALRVVEATSPDWIMVLKRVAVVSRMAGVVAPSGPLHFADFQTRRLSTLVLMAEIVHWFLVSTTERLRLRAYTLRRGFAIASRRMLIGRQRIARGDAASAVRSLEAARADLGQLSEETVRTVDTVIRSLGAHPRQPAA